MATVRSATALGASKRKAHLVATADLRARPDASGESKRARLQAKARTSVNTPQVMVIMVASVDPLEKQMREQRIDHTGELLCPPAQEDKEFYIQQGDVLMCDMGSGNGTRTTPDSGPPIAASKTPAGLPESYIDRLFMPSMAADHQHDGNNQVAMKVHGVDMQTNYDTNPIHCGDMLVVDPIPATVVAPKTGAIVPAIYGPKGTAEGTHRFRLRGHNPMRQQEWEMQHFDESRVRMGEQTFKDELLACKTGDDVYAVIRSHCERIFSELYHASVEDPVRPLLELWTAETLLTMVRCGGMPGARALGQSLLKALLLSLRETKEHYVNRTQQWRDELPHEVTKDISTLGADALGQGLDSPIYNNLVNDKPMAPEEYMQVDAHIRMSFNHYFRLQSHRVNDWLVRFTFGMALSSAEKGNNYDVFIGKK